MNRVLCLSACLLLCLSACNASSDDDDDATAAPAVYVPECGPPMQGACDNEASIVRGTVRLGESLIGEDPEGDLIISLTHLRLGGGAGGGFFHAQTVIEDVDLSAGPVPFQLDMCSGGAMYSEENCEYNLIAVLDRNGNGSGAITPDDGEPTGRIGDLSVSCGGDAPCVDLVLDCTDGLDCVAFEDPSETCSCASDACESIYAACE
ncbi:MAG: hypothetical protein KDA24_23355 [Deltaproteobacteria bacterium]|nr:hypothetical protein [Deltaproteobacteria bacterium]